jgi:hypothetical protein
MNKLILFSLFVLGVFVAGLTLGFVYCNVQVMLDRIIEGSIQKLMTYNLTGGL